MIDYGTDLIVRLNNIGRISGPENLLRTVARRLRTPRGGLFYDEYYGYDLRRWVHELDSDVSRYTLESGIEAECEKDPRVLEAKAEVTLWSHDTLHISIWLTTRAGDLALIASATEQTVEVWRETAL